MNNKIGIMTSTELVGNLQESDFEATRVLVRIIFGSQFKSTDELELHSYRPKWRHWGLAPVNNISAGKRMVQAYLFSIGKIFGDQLYSTQQWFKAFTNGLQQSQ